MDGDNFGDGRHQERRRHLPAGQSPMDILRDLPPWWCWRFNTVGGRGVQLAEKVSGERVGGVRCAFVRRVGVVVATHLLSWAVWRCGRAKALVERFWEITAPCRALSSLCRIDPEDGSRGAAGRCFRHGDVLTVLGWMTATADLVARYRSKNRATTAHWGASRHSGRDLPLRFHERYQCRRDNTRDPVVPLPGFLAKKGAKGHGDRDRRATQTGHEGEGSLMADVVRTVLTRQVPRLVVRAELTLTALQATFWIALIVVSAGAVLLLRRRRSAVPRVTDNTPGRTTPLLEQMQP